MLIKINYNNNINSEHDGVPKIKMVVSSSKNNIQIDNLNMRRLSARQDNSLNKPQLQKFHV